MKIVVGLGSCGIAAGGKKIYAVLKSLLAEHPEVKAELGGTGCCGMCYAEPLVEIREEGRTTLYGYVTEESAKEIFEWHVLHDTPTYKYAVRATNHTCAEEGFFEKQHRIVLARCGVIDPESLDEALAADAYQGLKKALTMQPEEIIEEMKSSGLRGRGGAGFPTGLKWSFARKNAADQKYVICNADEGDPGAFMDRSVLEGDPHSVIEGMVIGAYAIGASEGVVYARAEYPIAVKRVQKAIEEAEAAGFLGENILGSGFSFHLQIKQGAGAFVCGEETALMASVEGKRGMPSMRPPFPAESGLFGKPSNINNVETWANVGWILLHGAAEFAKLGTEKSKGTKVFALAGKIKRGGLVEVPIGMTLNEIVNDIGGGSRTGKPVKAVQLGG
ncbi:MAG TPA: NADH-quinone oxidoreductase subunit F, partial [Oscillospiraceae bacterium]|nr:NADH-quinone oxidoreductase subunit F [Oscillospiraceae bacterium]